MTIEQLISEITMHGEQVRIWQADGMWFVDTFGGDDLNVFEASYYSYTLHGALDGLLRAVIERIA